MDESIPKVTADELYEIVVEICKAKRVREEGNIGNNIADERSYKAHGKILESIRSDFWDRFIFCNFNFEIAKQLCYCLNSHS